MKMNENVKSSKIKRSFNSVLSTEFLLEKFASQPATPTQKNFTRKDQKSHFK